MLNSEIIKKIFFLLPKIKEHHNPDSAIFQYFKDFLESQFSEKKDLIFNFDPFNELNWKYIKCGNLLWDLALEFMLVLIMIVNQ